MKTNRDLLNEVYKSIITTGTFGQSVLSEEQAPAFVKVVQEKANLLSDMRFQLMTKQVQNIDRIEFGGRVLTGKSGGLNPSTDGATPTTYTNQLVAQFIKGIFSIEDTALRRNIEKAEIVRTLQDLFAARAALDLEDLIMYGDTENLDSDPLLSLTDGLIVKSANKIPNTKFDVEEDIESLFEALINAIPPKYIGDRSKLVFGVPFVVEQAYRKALKNRGTVLGDTVQTSGIQLAYEGIPVKHYPVLDRYIATDDGGSGMVAMLQRPANMVWGVFHEITMEMEREAKQFRTDFVYGLEADVNYEDENASAIAFLDKDTI